LASQGQATEDDDDDDVDRMAVMMAVLKGILTAICLTGGRLAAT
jgi:hypothetical protein